MDELAKKYGDDTYGRKLYVGNLSFKTDQSELKYVFGKYGDIDDVFLPIDGRGDARGFAFVTFADRRDAKEASIEMDDRSVDGRRVRCNIAKPRPPLNGRRGGGGGDRGYDRDRGGGGRDRRGGGRDRSSTSSKLYIGNLSMNATQRDLEDMFDKFGPIRKIDVKIPQRPPAFGFVEFEDRRDAEDAQEEMNGHKFDGERLRIEFSDR